MGLVDGSRLEGGGCLKQPLEKHRLGLRLGAEPRVWKAAASVACLVRVWG